MDVIADFIDYTKEYESPENFWRWAGYAMVAAVLRDSVYYDHGLRKTYPNIYVVLLADSAEYRKSGPFAPVIDLLQHEKVFNTKVIQGRASVQAILDELSMDVGSPLKNGTSLKGGSAILLAEELASFFVSDPQLVPMITDLYDYKNKWDYKLKGSGTTTIKNRCVTFLAASNETFLRDVYDTKAVFGGLLGRTFMVKPDERRKPNDLLNMDLANYNPMPIVESLVKIKTLKGAMRTSPSATTLYRDWYRRLYESYAVVQDKAGVTQRLHAGALKLSMIIAASQGCMEISEAQMEDAIMRVTSLRGNYEIFAMKSGKSEQAEVGALLLGALWKAPKHELTRKAFMFNNWQNCTAEGLDAVVMTLEAAEMVKTVASSSQVAYKMTPKCIAVFTEREKQI